MVRPDDAALAAALARGRRAHRPLRECRRRHGREPRVRRPATKDAAGWIVALGDMPWIQSSTIARVAAAIADGAVVAAPFHRGQRGHPVGFGAACFAELAALTGDDGAKSVVASHRRRPRAHRRRRCRRAARRRSAGGPGLAPRAATGQSLPSGCHMSGCSRTPRVSSSCAFHQARKSFSSSGRPIRNPCAASQPWFLRKSNWARRLDAFGDHAQARANATAR